jgi:uncharacterized repeat protein (TIGR01451 family)
MSRSRWAGRGRRRARLLAYLAVVVPLGMLGAFALAGPAAALPSNCAQSSSTTVTCTFSYTGAVQLFTVPAGVTSITVTADGAQGGLAIPSAGGLGGEARATFTVNPGDPVEVVVGGQGSFFSGVGAFNGGGSGGAGGASGGGDPQGDGGAGGGGASDVRTGTCAATLNCGLGNRVLVAGGGGGSVTGGGPFTGQGGGGGNPSGGTGAGGMSAGGGGGGSQTAGGTAGTRDGCSISSAGGAGGATPLPQDAGGGGGSGGSSSTNQGGAGGGGGGGGYWGGGGGGGACPDDFGGAGGGGSSNGPSGTTFTNNTNAGNGRVTISYTGTAAATTTTVSAPGTGTAGTAIAASAVSATLAGATSAAGGTITVTVFGPQSTAPTNCTTGGTTVGTAAVSGNNTYNPSAGFTPGSVGTYWWYASYGGDDQNVVSNSTCGTGMTHTVVKNPTTTTVSAPGTVTVGTAIAASSVNATLAGTASGTGTITVTVFGPTPANSPPADCTTGGTTVGTATVSGNNTYNPSAGFTPASAGTYWWYASYGGDDTNAASNSGCGTTGMTHTAVAPPPADLKITNSGAPDPVASGQRLTYTVIATNTGGQAATGVKITDTLPGSAHFNSATCPRAPGGPPKPKNGTVTCTVASLAGGDSVTLTITVTATKPGTINNKAQVTATNVTDSPDSDDTFIAAVTVQGT